MAAQARVDRVSFAGGEAGEAIRGRTDLAKYQISVEAMENYITMVEGGATRSPGTRLVLELKSSAQKGKLVPFRRSSSDYYMLVINAGSARFMRQGGFLQNPDTTPYEMAVPWVEADLPFLRTANTASAGKIYAVCKGKKPQEITRADVLSWTCVDFVATGGPVDAKNLDTAVKILASATTGNGIGLTATGGAPFLAGHVGGVFRLDDPDLSTIPEWNSLETGIPINALRRWKGNVYQVVGGAAAGPNAPTHTEGDVSSGAGYVTWRFIHPGYGFVRVTGFTDATHVTGDVVTRLPDNCASGSGTYRWWPPAWCDAAGWPEVIAWNSPRMFFGRNDLGWLSAVDDPHNLKVTGLDDDAIAFRLRAPDASLPEIKWALPSGVLIIGSSDLEWSVRGTAVFDALTSTNIRAVVEANEGSTDQIPVLIDGGPLWTGPDGKSLHYSKYDRQQQILDPDEISIAARHIFGSAVVAKAWQRRPHRVLWMVLADGTLAGMTYMPKQQILAFHRHPRTNAFFEDVGVIPSTSTGLDEIYFIVRRTIANQTRRFVEQLADFFQPADKSNPTAIGAWFLDCALHYSGAPIGSLTSLTHLEGQEVGVFADGRMQKRKTVVGGRIDLDRAASDILVGIPVRARLRDLPRNVNSQTGTTEGEYKTVHDAVVHLLYTGGGTISVNDGPEEPLIETGRKKYGAPIVLYSGKKRPNLEGDVETEATLEILNDDAMPCTVLAMSPELEIEEEA
jgi:hypothetical protein